MYHFVGSYMANQCQLPVYPTNSAWLHATAPSPLGPFIFQEQVLPPFHHGAQVGRYIDGSFYIVGDGENTPSNTWHTCGLGRRHLRPAGKHKGGGLWAFGRSPQDYHVVATAQRMSGPWTTKVIMETDLSNIHHWSCNLTNLSPLALSNGTIVMSFRSRSCVSAAIQAVTCRNMCQFIGLAVSTNGWNGPFIKQANPIAAFTGNEDPFLWQDERGYHILMHGKLVCGYAGVGTCGSLGYSADLVNWYFSPQPAYGAQVQLSDRTVVELALRQRPQILFNSDMVPLVLYNGVQLQGESYVRNVAIAFNTAAMRNWQPPPPCPPKARWLFECETNA